jgi:integration host factor subunit beta
MTKSDLVEKLSESLTSLTKKECEVIVDTVFLNMKDAKEGRNPKTGEKVAIPEKRIPFFKVGKELREMVNG